jgi:transposase
LYVAFELGWNTWKLAFATAAPDNPRLKTVKGRDTAAVLAEIAKAKTRFRLPADAPVVCCYEAGRDGHWLHRFLNTQPGITCHQVDSSSIEVNRRRRRAKTDALDVGKLLSMLLRDAGGEKNVWRVVHVPTPEAEDRRHLHRELEDWVDSRRQWSNRIKGLLANHGIDVTVGADFLDHLPALRDPVGRPLLPGLRATLARGFKGWQLADEMVRELKGQQGQAVRAGADPCQGLIRRLLTLKGIGTTSAWVFVMEVFGWRKVANRRQMGSLAGLTPTPYTSGDSAREQGISKAGNRRLRVMALEIAWCWVQNQPDSDLTRWFLRRFGVGNRQRKIGIVAVARKLLVALWKFLEHDQVPAGAILVEWKSKARVPRAVAAAAARVPRAGMAAAVG